MQITDVSASTHVVPVDVPLRDDVKRRQVAVARVETDEGTTGHGLAAKPQLFGYSALINEEIGPLIEGMNPLDNERIYKRSQLEINPRYQTGAWSSAMSAVDIALWDIAGKHYDEPVWRLLGGAQNPVGAYVTFGLKNFTREQLAEVAADFVSRGETRLKMKVGINDAGDLAEDEARVAAVREAVGDDVELMIDANHEFSLNQAIRLCDRLEPYDIAWFEEPVYQNDAALLSKLRNRTSIPISAGQNEGTRYRHRELIENDAVDLVNPNVVYGGGYTESRKIAHLAQAYNLDIANGGGWPHHNAHLHAGMENGWRVEFHYIMYRVGEKLFDDPPHIDGNQVELSEAPGLGFDPDPDALARYEVESGSSLR
ncbi:MAG: L-alanine-DL-glutamate epimerase related enzymes of enolase superfamily [uncultured archaeon A07HB70]|nr:MAG: L-alanine-DL-glutamate epimerase related enzymes of enolase superfamily [uncultured archaeon A07HB70]